MGLEDLGLTGQLDAGLLQPRPQRLSESLELLLRLPDLAHSNVFLGTEADVKLATVRRPVAGFFERIANRVVMVLGHVRERKKHNDAHQEPPQCRVSQAYSRSSSEDKSGTTT